MPHFGSIQKHYDDAYAASGDAAFFCDDARYSAFLAKVPEAQPGANHPTGGQLRVLDIGCGTGVVLERLAGQGYEVAGVDISENALAQARSRVQAGDFQIAQPNGLLNHSDGRFSLVICFGVLEHIQVPHTVVREAYRVCEPAGRAVFVVPNKRSPYFLVSGGTGQVQEYPRSLERWQTMFENAGFVVESVDRDPGPSVRAGVPLSTQVKSVANRLLNALPLTRTYQFIFTLKKSDSPSA